MAAAGEFPHCSCVKPFAHLAQIVQVDCIAAVARVSPGAGGAIHFAGFVEIIPVDLILFDGLPGESDGLPIQCDQRARSSPVPA